MSKTELLYHHAVSKILGAAFKGLHSVFGREHYLTQKALDAYRDERRKIPMGTGTAQTIWSKNKYGYKTSKVIGRFGSGDAHKTTQE